MGERSNIPSTSKDDSRRGLTVAVAMSALFFFAICRPANTQSESPTVDTHIALFVAAQTSGCSEGNGFAVDNKENDGTWSNFHCSGLSWNCTEE